MSIVFAIADNLDLAWSILTFFTLPANCPYHVEGEGKPLDRLKRALLRENRQLPKYFFSGPGAAASQRNLRHSSFPLWEKSSQKTQQEKPLEKR